MKNFERADGTINYRILEMGMFGCYESTYGSISYNNSLSSYSFIGNLKQILTANALKYIGIKGFETQIYVSKE